MYTRWIEALSANRRLLVALVVFAALPLAVTIGLPSSAQSPESAGQKRTFKMKDKISVPLEVQVRNLESETWLKDLEIEVKNVGKKPIYSIVAYLMLPDSPIADSVGIPFDYGNPKNVRLDRIAEADDPRIDPGESFVFKVDEKIRKGTEMWEKASPTGYRHTELWIEIISFGDGTGLINGRLEDYRKKTVGLLELDTKKKRTGSRLM
jgi:hypothetical protein